MTPKSMRTFLDQLASREQLLRVSRPVDIDTEMGALNWEAVARRKKAILYDNIKGYPGWRAVSGITGTRENIAISLETSIVETTRTIMSKLGREVPPCVMVDSGPVKDVKLVGPEADLFKLPVSVVSEGDAGRFIGAGFLVCRDPETGIRNLSIHRHQIKAPQKMGIMMVAGRHAWGIYQKYKRRGEPMPVAIVVGHHPALIIASTWTTGPDVDEYDIASALLGESLPLVRGETVDLEVPAEAEVVIEGCIPPDYLEQEGPFGEHTGCTVAGTGLNPVVTITAITHRREPILFEITEGPSTDGAILDAIPMEVELYKRLKDVGGYTDLKAVVVHECVGGAHMVVVQMTPHWPGEVKGVLMAALSSTYLHPKIAIAVDDDVNPYEPSEILWSLSTKVNPVEDVFIVAGTRGHSLDSSLTRLSAPGVNPVIHVGSRMGIDATKPSTFEPERRAALARILPKGYGTITLDDVLR